VSACREGSIQVSFRRARGESGKGGGGNEITNEKAPQLVFGRDTDQVDEKKFRFKKRVYATNQKRSYSKQWGW